MPSSHPNPFLGLQSGTHCLLPEADRFTEAGHLWTQGEIDALILAFAARRPLLVRGEAGSGKSQIARAAAAVMANEVPLVEVIHPRFEALDLLYRLDALERLADAQNGQLDPNNERYIKKGSLWQAIERMGVADTVPVLLIDEIDKADADVPNALLDVLSNRSFTVPLLDNKAIRADSGRLPLIIITTNEERELPAAFVRRCVVLNINPPEKNDDAFIAWLAERGRVHSHLDIAEQARSEAAVQVLTDRKAAIAAGYPPVGLAEYIDLLTALQDLSDGLSGEQRADEQLAWLRRLSVYALVKNAGQSQVRVPIVQSIGKSLPE